MFDRIKLWYARRCALKALCVSLENSPETWTELSSKGATQGNLRIVVDVNMFNKEIYTLKIYVNDQVTEPSKRWQRKLVRALRNAVEFDVLKQAMRSLGSCPKLIS